MLITYLARKRLVLRNCLYGALALFFLVTSFQWLGDWPTTIEMLAYNSDFMFITVLPFISLYNGEREQNTIFQIFILRILSASFMADCIDSQLRSLNLLY